jgi:hypothetical protein
MVAPSKECTLHARQLKKLGRWSREPSMYLGEHARQFEKLGRCSCAFVNLTCLGEFNKSYILKQIPPLAAVFITL